MSSLYEFGRFVLDPAEHRLTLDGEVVAVTPKAFDILVALVQRAPRLVTKEQLMKEVWPDSFVEEANLTVHVSALRKTLSDAGDQDRYIETVPRRGYRFVVPVRVSESRPHVISDADFALPRPHASPTPEVASSFLPPIAEPPVHEEPATIADRSTSGETPTPAPTVGTRWPLLAGLAASAIVAVLIGWYGLQTSSAGRGDFSWERIATEGRLRQLLASETGATDPAVSPDGRTLAYVQIDENGNSDLFVTNINGGGELRLTNDSAVEQYPRFSPDGDRVLFSRLAPQSRLAELRVMSVLGGESKLITRGFQGAWSPGGDRVAYIGHTQPDSLPGLYSSSLDGTDVRELLSPSSAYPFVRFPDWSPDGNSIAVMRGTGGVAGEIWVVPLTGGEPRRFTTAPAEVWCAYPAFTPDGSGIIYTSNRGGAANLWIQMLDSNRSIRLTTGPGPESYPTISNSGLISFMSSRSRDEMLVHTLSNGANRTLLTHAPFLWAPVFAPDGSEITFSRSEVDGTWHVWSMPLEKDAPPRQLTVGQLGELHPRYTVDGRWVLYHSWGTPRHVWRIPRQGGAPVQLTFGDYDDGYADPSPDGEHFAFARTDGVERIHVAPLAGGEARAITSRPSTVPRWSPDGKLIAFSPSRAFNGGIFVMAPDGSGERRLTDVGGWPVWWPDGQQIAYLAIGPNGGQQIWSVPLIGGTPRLLESLTFTDSNYPFDIARDGRRIIASRNQRISREVWLLQGPGT